MTSSPRFAATPSPATCQIAVASWIAGVVLWLMALALLITIR